MAASANPSKTSGPHTRDWFTDGGLLVAALSAIVSSGTALAGLARLAGWPTWLAVMLPATVDVYAIIATRVWLSRHTTSEAVRRYAKGNALSAIAASIVGNAVYHALVAGAVQMPRWVLVVAVSMVPPTVIAALAHMTALRTREHGTRATATRKPNRADSDPVGKTGPVGRNADRSSRPTASADLKPDRRTHRTSGPVRVLDRDQFAEAVRTYRTSAANGEPLSERKLADRFGQSRRWARKVIGTARHEDGHRDERDDKAADGPYLAFTSTEASGGAR